MEKLELIERLRQLGTFNAAQAREIYYENPGKHAFQVLWSWLKHSHIVEVAQSGKRRNRDYFYRVTNELQLQQA